MRSILPAAIGSSWGNLTEGKKLYNLVASYANQLVDGDFELQLRGYYLRGPWVTFLLALLDFLWTKRKLSRLRRSLNCSHYTLVVPKPSEGRLE